MTRQDGWAPPAPSQTTVLIGDIHGCMEKLTALMARVEADLAAGAEGDPVIVFVGDFVDRGAASKEVLTFVHDAQTRAPECYVCLMGNHERMMLDFINDPADTGKRWLKFGGLETVGSYGLSIRQGLSGFSGTDLLDLAFDLEEELGEDMLDWLEALPKSWNSGTLWAVHAAADPATSMANQSEKTLMWGHPAFESDTRDDGQWVAHGHTPVDAPEAAEGRIRLDTGAVYGNTLTAARVDPDGQVRFISV